MRSVTSPSPFHNLQKENLNLCSHFSPRKPYSDSSKYKSALNSCRVRVGLPALRRISVSCLASSLVPVLEKKSKQHLYNTAHYKLQIGTQEMKNNYKRGRFVPAGSTCARPGLRKDCNQREQISSNFPPLLVQTSFMSSFFVLLKLTEKIIKLAKNHYFCKVIDFFWSEIQAQQSRVSFLEKLCVYLSLFECLNQIKTSWAQLSSTPWHRGLIIYILTYNFIIIYIFPMYQL